MSWISFRFVAQLGADDVIRRVYLLYPRCLRHDHEVDSLYKVEFQ